MKKIAFAFLYLTIILGACKKQVSDSEITSIAGSSVNLNKDLMLKLVNDKRASGCKCGVTVMPPVPALMWNNLLAAAALAHSTDMNINNFFEHTSSNGKTPGDRITAAGYKWSTYGENIAAGQISEQSVFDAWINSEGHCKNIMNANFREMGAAKDGKYWTQDFGRSSN